MVLIKAKKKLIRLLQNAHAGELAAAHAYQGHANSVSSEEERREILKIRDEELEHRDHLGRMLAKLGSKPRASREFAMTIIGRTIGFLCHIGGWYIPMYGAGRLELSNILEYQIAADLAKDSGLDYLVDDLVLFSAVEARHEEYFRLKLSGHWLRKIIKPWSKPDL